MNTYVTEKRIYSFSEIENKVKNIQDFKGNLTERNQMIIVIFQPIWNRSLFPERESRTRVTNVIGLELLSLKANRE